LRRLQFSASIDIMLQRGLAMDFLTLATFALAFFMFAASPGPDNMTIVARTLTHGTGSGLAYGLGTVTGILLFLALATFGLGLIASEMGFAMTILRYAGALWLIWTGIRLWTAKAKADPGNPVRSSILATYFTGVALNLGNPKMPLFYVALLPNIAGTALDFRMAAELAVIILLVEAVVIGGHVGLALRSRRILRSPKIMRRVNRTAGTVMIGSGALALAAR
jgi:threonine/homoserine/homoserine lactone efflux protein